MFHKQSGSESVSEINAKAGSESGSGENNFGSTTLLKSSAKVWEIPADTQFNSAFSAQADSVIPRTVFGKST
jgi:hypothetical protein